MSERETIIKRIAAEIPDDVDLGDERAVIEAIAKIEFRMASANDETIQQIVTRARANRICDRIGSAIGIVAIAAATWVFVVGYSGPVYAATGPVESHAGNVFLALAAVFILGVAAWIGSKPFADEPDLYDRSPDIDALNRADEVVPPAKAMEQ